jgi:hypothetical protein
MGRIMTTSRIKIKDQIKDRMNQISIKILVKMI